jgi:hypothetical protein
MNILFRVRLGVEPQGSTLGLASHPRFWRASLYDI